MKEGKEEDLKTKSHQQRVMGLAPGQHIPRILVADDTEENRRLLVNLLTLVGFNVREAVNGYEALKIFEQWKPNFIWMDIRMPVMDGLEATRHIKATELGKQTKVVALSASVFGEERNEILAAGFNDFVGKPFRENEVFDVMEKHLVLNYVYEALPKKEDAEVLTSDLSLNVRSLHADMCTELQRAVTNTDAIKIAEIAEQIKMEEPVLAKALHRCAKNFDYEPIRIALQNNVKAGE
jgi:CheY-like chemotaxis protein